MPALRLLMNLLLVLALVASGPLPAFAADHAPLASAAAPCHDVDGPAPSPADADADTDADCCGGEPGHCGCECLQHVAAAPLRLQRLPQIAPATPDTGVASRRVPRSPAPPDTRPPIA